MGTRKVPEISSPNISRYVQAAAEQAGSSGGADRLVDDERREGQAPTAITLSAPLVLHPFTLAVSLLSYRIKLYVSCL